MQLGLGWLRLKAGLGLKGSINYIRLGAAPAISVKHPVEAAACRVEAGAGARDRRLLEAAANTAPERGECYNAQSGFGRFVL